MKRIFINNQIRANEVRVVDETGKQSGIMGLAQALQLAKEKGLDLIQVTEKVIPPVCRITDYGKYLYHLQKKERAIRPKGGELKIIRLTFNISPHDLETRAKTAEKFLKGGDVVRIDLPLRGRQKALGGFAREKMSKFVEAMGKLIPIKVEKEIRREARGFSMIIAKQ